MRKLHVKSYGCQMNVYDANRMTDLLTSDSSYVETGALEEADLVILNTCHIREKAAEKVYSELGRIRQLKREATRAGRHLIVAVAGCVAQAEGEEIVRRAPVVDVVVFCTFCVVPYTRGAEASRPVAAIVAEVENLARAGVREVTLIGQNVNAYHGRAEDGGQATLGGLLNRLADVAGVLRLRYTTSHPRDVDEDLVAAHRDLAVLMPQLHLPVQSGSDRVLAAMNRRHTRAEYLDVVARLRTVRPDIAFTSDFIVGFPGETEEDFIDTLRIVEDVGFAGAFSFKYSPRPGTPAAERGDQIADEVKRERLARLQERIDHHQRAFNRSCAGRKLEVLFEKPGRIAGQLVGRSAYLQPVQVMAPTSLIGQIATVRITDLGSNSLFGELERAEARDQALAGTGG